MFKIFFLVISLQASILFAYDFKKEFSRILNQSENPESQLYGSSSAKGNDNEQILNFPQKLNHFKLSDKTTWQQRSFIVDKYYQKHGPFFFYIFGNEEGSHEWLRKSQILDYAKDSNALVIALEHRFYGKSRPFSNTSLENLNYLNIQQALSDIAYFIEIVNGIPIVPPNTKWILFGGFYGGSLAAWARMRYPHLVHGAVASSALISMKTDLPEYLESVQHSYLSYNYACAKNIASGNQEFHQALQTEEGRDKISKLFRVCDSLRNQEDDKAILRGLILYGIYTAVEENNDKHLSMKVICDLMNNNATSPMENLAKVNRQLQSLKDVRCWYTKHETITRFYREDRYEQNDQSSRLWFYQSCTQIGLDFSTSKSVDMFGEDKPEIESTARYCKEFFGPEFDKETIDEGVKHTNIEFGAKAFNASRVIFVQGSLDPWAAAGIGEKSENALYHVIRINGISHCADLIPSQDINVREGIRQIKGILSSWLV